MATYGPGNVFLPVQMCIWAFKPFKDLGVFKCAEEIIFFNVWVRYFVWNFKGILWDSTQTILGIHWECVVYWKVKIKEVLDLWAWWARKHFQMSLCCHQCRWVKHKQHWDMWVGCAMPILLVIIFSIFPTHLNIVNPLNVTFWSDRRCHSYKRDFKNLALKRKKCNITNIHKEEINESGFSNHLPSSVMRNRDRYINVSLFNV